MKMFLLLFILTVGCAPVYKYIPFDGEKYGYRNGQFSDDTYWVEYLSWKGFSGGFRSEKYTLLRCAELTKENSYNYFVVLTKKWEILGPGIQEGHRFTIQCYKEKPTNIDFNALDNYAVIYDVDMVIKNYQYLYDKEDAKKRFREK